MMGARMGLFFADESRCFRSMNYFVHGSSHRTRRLVRSGLEQDTLRFMQRSF